MSTHPGPIDTKLQELQKRYPHRFKDPVIHSDAWVAPGAQIFGDVQVGAQSSVWFNCVARGDVNYIRIGERSNIQDLSMIHVTYKGNPTIIGNDVTIGHSCILHACSIGDFALVGMGSCILDGAEIGEWVLLGAGSLVTQGTKIPPYSKAFGRPAKVVAKLTDAEIEALKFSPSHYVQLMNSYKLRGV